MTRANQMAWAAIGVIGIAAIGGPGVAAAAPMNATDVGGYWIMGPAASVVQEPGVPGGVAQRVTVDQPGDIWADSAHSSVIANVAKGRELTVTAWLKSDSSNGHANIKLEENDAPYSAVGEKAVSPTGSWVAYSFKVTPSRDYKAGALSVVIQYGDAKQTIYVGPITVETATPNGAN
jgi:hypothetical protein